MYSQCPRVLLCLAIFPDFGVLLVSSSENLLSCGVSPINHQPWHCHHLSIVMARLLQNLKYHHQFHQSKPHSNQCFWHWCMLKCNHITVGNLSKIWQFWIKNGKKQWNWLKKGKQENSDRNHSVYQLIRMHLTCTVHVSSQKCQKSLKNNETKARHSKLEWNI
jgi:hypothetical protein